MSAKSNIKHRDALGTRRGPAHLALFRQVVVRFLQFGLELGALQLDIFQLKPPPTTSTTPSGVTTYIGSL